MLTRSAKNPLFGVYGKIGSFKSKKPELHTPVLMTWWLPSTGTSLKIAGACGIASIIVAGVATSLAIFYSSGFSYTQNWLSDLGGTSYAAFLNVPRPSVSSPTTILLSQWGLFVAGLLAIVFAVGLFLQADSPVYRLGAALGIVGTAGLCAEGIFLAPSGVPHLMAYYTFGLLAPTRCSSSEVRLSFQKNGWRDARLRWALSLSEAHR
ncbi:MAG: DUF998 domain-containing protein [Euryarchaeota archaeon]|nr:DUF998 domain-containing protein [Euryarchaeota archaeon]